MTMNKAVLCSTIGGLLLCANSAFAVPVPVDLSTWTAETLAGNGVSGPGASWNVQNPPLNDEVFQTVNGNASVFFEKGATSQGKALNGKIKVTGSDDDFIGFVLGYDAGEMNSAVTDFLLIDWKGRSQSIGCGNAPAGLAISRVTSANNTDACGFWAHDDGEGVEELARANTLGSTGWDRNIEYAFDLVFNDSLVEVFVDGVKELSVTAAKAGGLPFDDGSFGFYNLSQGEVLYSAIEQRDAPVKPPVDASAPATWMLLVMGLPALLSGRRKRHSPDR